jgi:hypothetical protein
MITPARVSRPASPGDRDGQAAHRSPLRLDDESGWSISVPCGLERVQRLGQAELGAEENAVGVFDSSDLLVGEAVPREAHCVEAGQFGAITLRRAYVASMPPSFPEMKMQSRRGNW